MFLEKISWVQAQEYFEKKDIAIIPVGSTENHGSQLCLGTDFLIPRKLCEMMDERLDVMVVPTIPYGVGDQHSNFPGTITIGADGLYDLVTRIVNELYRFGIWPVFFEFEDVSDISTTPRVNRLVVIPDCANILVLGRKHPDQLVLNLVDVLKLIY